MKLYQQIDKYGPSYYRKDPNFIGAEEECSGRYSEVMSRFGSFLKQQLKSDQMEES